MDPSADWQRPKTLQEERKQVRGYPSLSRLASLGPGTNSSLLLEGPLLAKGPLTGETALACTEGVSGEGRALAEGAPGGRAVATARLLALEGSKQGLLVAGALCEAQAVGDAEACGAESELGATVLNDSEPTERSALKGEKPATALQDVGTVQPACPGAMPLRLSLTNCEHT